MQFNSEMSESVYRSKYMLEGVDKDLIDPLKRIDAVVTKYYPHLKGKAIEYGSKKWVGFAGGLYRSANNPNQNVSAINCTTLYSPKDNLESIADSWYWWAKFSAYGQGEGVDVSNLRPSGAVVHNSSTNSTGPVSFMRTYDGILKEIAQQGRRGASLISLNISHPDIPEFITCKDSGDVLETANLSIKITNDFMDAVLSDSDWTFIYKNNYEVIERSTSAKKLFHFIAEHAHKTGDPGLLFWDTSTKYSNSDVLGVPIENVNACCITPETCIQTDKGCLPIIEIFDRFNGGESFFAESYNIDTNKKELKPVSNAILSGRDEVIITVSIMDECDNLTTINCTPKHLFYTTVKGYVEAQSLQCGDELVINKDGLISGRVEKVVSENIRSDVYDLTVDDNHNFFANGVLIHNSEQVLDGHSTCILSSINLAKFHEYGPDTYKELVEFLVFALDAFRLQEIEEERSPSKEQIRKMIEMPRIGVGITGFADYLIRKGIVYGSDESIGEVRWLLGTLSGQSYKTSHKIAKDFIGKSFPLYDKEAYKTSPFVQNLLRYGFIDDEDLDYQAHVCKTTIAPTGSLSMIVEAGGSGIEPIFSKYFVRRERSTSNDWKEWFIYNDLVDQYLRENELEVTKENADKLNDDFWVTAHTVDNFDKIKLMSEAQKFIDSAISVTYNLPEDCTVEDVENIYMEAWRHELKGVTVYREGSKAGVLITEANYNAMRDKVVEVHEDGVKKRPKDLMCDIYQIKYKSDPYLLLVGIFDNIPYEIFVTPLHDNDFDIGKHKNGIIRKNGKGKYDLHIVNGEEKKYISDIVGEFDSTYGTLSRFISMSLRHKVPIQFIIDQLSKDKNFLGFERTVARVLKKYIKDGEKVKTSTSCPNCGSTEFVFVGGCSQCSSCGYSKCD